MFLYESELKNHGAASYVGDIVSVRRRCAASNATAARIDSPSPGVNGSSGIESDGSSKGISGLLPGAGAFAAGGEARSGRGIAASISKSR
jgi:hypothetical protein